MGVSRKVRNPSLRGGVVNWLYKWRNRRNMSQLYKGYRRIWNNDIRAWEYEHRVIYQKYLGRKLRFNEHIHHVNGDKTDNRLVNLILVSDVDHEKLHRNGSRRRKYYTCTFDDCNNTHHAKGLCKKHYAQATRGN